VERDDYCRKFTATGIGFQALSLLDLRGLKGLWIERACKIFGARRRL
jgi:hypothetical protein